MLDVKWKEGHVLFNPISCRPRTFCLWWLHWIREMKRYIVIIYWIYWVFIYFLFSLHTLLICTYFTVGIKKRKSRSDTYPFFKSRAVHGSICVWLWRYCFGLFRDMYWNNGVQSTVCVLYVIQEKYHKNTGESHNKRIKKTGNGDSSSTASVQISLLIWVLNVSKEASLNEPHYLVRP